MRLFSFLLLFSGISLTFTHKSANTKPKEWDWEKLEKMLSTLAHKYKLENILPYLDIKDSNISTNCKEDLLYLATSVDEFVHEVEETYIDKNGTISSNISDFILPMLDSSGKVGPGILRGHIHFFGLFSECREVSHYVPDLNRKINGDYYRIFFDLFHHGAANCSEPYFCPSLDICLPKSCKDDDLTSLFQSLKNRKKKSPVLRAEHINAHIPKKDVGTFIMIFFMAVLVGACLLSSIVDYWWFDNTDLKRFDKPLQILLSFSFHRNVIETFSISEDMDKRTSCIYCIRFFSISWIIGAHSYGFFVLLLKNPLDLLDNFKKGFFSVIYANAFPAVDSFFFLSGLLLAYLWFQEFRKNKAQNMTIRAWVYFYLNRFLRISPPYYITLLFYTYIMTSSYTDMPALLMSEVQNDTCRSQWLLNALYINNFVNSEKMCYIVSWYLAVDMQLFIFSPLILIPFVMSGYVGGLTAALSLLSASIGLAVYQVYRWDFPPIVYQLNEHSAEIATEYRFWMYYMPYIRCQPYIIGMVTGYFLQYQRRFRIHHVLNALLFILSLTTMCLVVFGLHDFISGSDMTILQSAMYNGVAKIGWSLALAWITIACYFGLGGALQSFMCWWVWIPLGRLSFCAYLIHIPLLLFVWGLDKQERVYVTEIDALINHVLPSVFIAFTAAIVWRALVEMPFSKIVTVLFKRQRREPINPGPPTILDEDMEKISPPLVNSPIVPSVPEKEFTSM